MLNYDQKKILWAYEIPYFVSYIELDGSTVIEIEVADKDFQKSYAPEPITWNFPTEAVEECGGWEDYAQTLLDTLAPAHLAAQSSQAFAA